MSQYPFLNTLLLYTEFWIQHVSCLSHFKRLTVYEHQSRDIFNIFYRNHSSKLIQNSEKFSSNIERISNRTLYESKLGTKDHDINSHLSVCVYVMLSHVIAAKTKRQILWEESVVVARNMLNL